MRRGRQRHCLATASGFAKLLFVIRLEHAPRRHARRTRCAGVWEGAGDEGFARRARRSRLGPRERGSDPHHRDRRRLLAIRLRYHPRGGASGGAGGIPGAEPDDCRLPGGYRYRPDRDGQRHRGDPAVLRIPPHRDACGPRLSLRFRADRAGLRRGVSHRLHQRRGHPLVHR